MTTKAESKTVQNNEKASYLFQFSFFVIMNDKNPQKTQTTKTSQKIENH